MRKRKLVTCIRCNQIGPHAAHGLCNRCYKAQPEIAERGRKQALAWYYSHADEVNARQLAYRRTSKGNKKRNDRLRWSYANNKSIHDKRLHRILKRQNMKRGAEGTHTFQEWRLRLEEYNYCRAYCLKPLDKPTQDHMVSIIAGGSNLINNIVPACGSCNSSKGGRTLLQFVVDTRGKW